MYPLNVQTAGPRVAYAVANDEAEHAALTVAGYLPALKGAEEPANADGQTVASVRAQLDAAGIAYDKRLGLAKLIALLP